MKPFFTLILSCLMFAAFSQTFNNEWIKYNQTYYKFRIGKEGVYRIPKTLLDAAGIGNTQVQNFELWRNGKKVPVYSSVTTGNLPADGYLEFWGMPNDGEPDKQLYRDPNFQHTTKTSLQSDTANYFLSVNSDQSGLLVSNQPNNVASNTLPVEKYFMHVAGTYYKERMNLGNALIVGEYIYSSSYDKGEYWSTNFITPATPRITTISNLNVYPAGPSSQIRFGANGNSLNSRTIRVSVNDNLLLDTLTEYFYDVLDTIDFPTSLITSNAASVKFTNNSTISSDRLTASFFELVYPRTFDFGGLKNFEFSLPADLDGYYLEITNFNAGAQAPVLYDLSSAVRYVADQGVLGKLRFVLPPASGTRRFMLVSQDPSNITLISNFSSKQFVNYNLTANQGNYIIISHPYLNVGTNGRKPLDEYKAYRSSASGGSYQVVFANIDELVDQFAFGIDKHPLSVRNFLKFARAKFNSPVKYCFLIGRGMTYNEYRMNNSDTLINKLNTVPTFGTPASDNLLSAESLLESIPATPIGRLAVVRGSEIEDYLQKLIEYEAVQKNAPNTMAGRAWMKNILHVTGASDPYLGVVLCDYMSVYKELIQDTLMGSKVITFCKNSTNPNDLVTNEEIKRYFAEGMSALTYFGHSSATTLEFNIENPQDYNNQGKYPVFFVNGCNAGNFFTYYPQRMIVNETLSEKFVLAKQRGSIAFVASTHFGIVNYLNIYLYNLYQSLSGSAYGKGLGDLQRSAMLGILNAVGSEDFYARTHMEQITLQGDPALHMNVQGKPDYVIEEPMIKLNPSFISVAEDSFKVQLNIANLGKATLDSLGVEVKRQYPDGSVNVIWKGKIPAVAQLDSLIISLPIVATKDKGNNRIIVTLDNDQKIDEIAENNNTAFKDFFIYEDEARPVYPYNLSIINNPLQKLYASTANPFSLQTAYVMEIDTTSNFNSPSKISKTVSSIGGLIEFQPGISFRDSVVYYWRVATQPINGGEYRWNSSSFVFLSGTKEGFGQSHYFQFRQSKYERLLLDSNTRKLLYDVRVNNVFIRNAIYPYSGTQDSHFSVSINNNMLMRSACVGRSLIFNVIDPVTMIPWSNVGQNGANLFRFGSGSANCAAGRNFNFEYSYLTPASRKKMMDFMDSIPNGYYVTVRLIANVDPSMVNSYSATWQSDTALYGSNNSLYHKMLNAGFRELDSLNKQRTWAGIYKKADKSFTPKMAFSSGIYDAVSMAVDCNSPDTIGYITSPVYGPAKSWKSAVWQGYSEEVNSSDNPSVDVIGIDRNGTEVLLYSMDKNTHEMDLSSISAIDFPNVKLKMTNMDSINRTPYQLKYWQVYYQPVPEGALTPNIYLSTKDSLDIGEPLNFGVGFKNVSKMGFDSLRVKLMVIDRNNQQNIIPLGKFKGALPGDSVNVKFKLDTKTLAGNNIMMLDVNPDNDQPEQHHFNNFLYRNFYVKPDLTNPLMDVTFDGIHILNKDLVSSKPHILIKLKDNAKYLLLNDTALGTVQLRYPNGQLKTYRYDNDTLRFTPASSTQDNTATIDFYPSFAESQSMEGDEYELLVKGKDVSGNKAGDVAYNVVFKVVSKPMISNMLNYPNPFSSFTAFVFTLTGSEIPQQLKIQILTVTGKIVREITKDELGPLHIGRNITDFRWDGTDQFGEKLANGIYLYRVVAGMNGQIMDKYTSEGEKTNRFFNNGYGKMYLMR